MERDGERGGDCYYVLFPQPSDPDGSEAVGEEAVTQTSEVRPQCVTKGLGCNLICLASV